MENISILDPIANKSDVKQSLSFQVPTEITKLDPVFLFRFYPEGSDIETEKVAFEVVLNPKLSSGSADYKQRYEFNDKGVCKINHQAGDKYFIEGDIEYINTPDYNENDECFVSITYGNCNEALHFIKGKFKLKSLKH